MAVMDLMSKPPVPGMAYMLSITREPESISRKSEGIFIAMGTIALRKMWRHIMKRLGRPLTVANLI